MNESFCGLTGQKRCRNWCWCESRVLSKYWNCLSQHWLMRLTKSYKFNPDTAELDHSK